MTKYQRWAAWAVLTLATVLVLFSILKSVSDRVTDAEQVAVENQTALAQANDKVAALGSQVTALGETPVVSTKPVPSLTLIAGPRGFIGLTGPAGRAGMDGLSITGPTGDTGIRGTAGNLGPVGPTGATGEPGTDGTNGKDGTDGANGKDGKDGSNATDAQIDDRIAAYCAVNACIQGKPGPVGPAGPVGPTGPQGEQGPQGIPGPAGGTTTP